MCGDVRSLEFDQADQRRLERRLYRRPVPLPPSPSPASVASVPNEVDDEDDCVAVAPSSRRRPCRPRATTRFPLLDSVSVDADADADEDMDDDDDDGKAAGS